MIALLLVLFACNGAAAPECVDNGNCNDGEACIDKACVVVECLASVDCAFGSYCDVENNAYTCTVGCSSDDDCMAGEACNLDNNECEAYGCRDTDLDCSFGEVCDEGDGTCYEPEGEWCTPCSDPYFGDPDICGDGFCFNFNEDSNFNRDNFCLPACNGEGDACARGYECIDVSGGGDYYCVTNCTAVP
jgi:hypothetical protein